MWIDVDQRGTTPFIEKPTATCKLVAKTDAETDAFHYNNFHPSNRPLEHSSRLMGKINDLYKQEFINKQVYLCGFSISTVFGGGSN